LNADSTALVLAGGKTYEVIFTTTGEPLFIEWLFRAGKRITRAHRYLDVALPPDVTARLTVSDGALSALEYDADGDSIYDSQVEATAAFEGKAARDRRDPSVKLEATPARGGTRVTLTANDRGTGVAVIAYSLDGVHFHEYNAPFTVDASVGVIYAFADDRAGNRSKLYELELEP
jgi:hypothetical protein